jgi:uncharacterized protein (TIGR02246 family)
MQFLKKPSRPTALFLGVLVLLGLGPACSKENEEHERAEQRAPADTSAADEAAIGALSAAWSKAMAAKDVEKSVSFYADDASMFPDRAPIARGKEAIHAVWETLLTTPGFSGSFSTTRVEVAKASDMAYEIGIYELATNDKKGKPQTEKGKYVVVWKRQADGNWKAVADIFNADQ